MKVLRDRTFTKRTPLQKLGIKFKYKVLRNLDITNPGTAGRMVQKAVDAPVASLVTAIAPGGLFYGPSVIRPAEKTVWKAVKFDEKMSKASVPAGRATSRFVKKVKTGVQNLKNQVTPFIQTAAGGRVQVAYNQ